MLHVFSAAEHRAVRSAAMSPDGRRAVSGHQIGTVIAWDVENRAVLHVLQGHNSSISGIAISPDASRAISGSIDGLETWQKVRRFEGHSRTVYALALSADGERILSGALDGTARLWETATGREILMLNPPSRTINAVAFAPGGVMLTGGSDRAIRIWPPEGGRATAVFPGAPD